MQQIEDRFIEHNDLIIRMDVNSSAMHPSVLYQHVVEWVHQTCALAIEAENKGMGKQGIRSLLYSSREIHGISEWIRRLQTWPRGYPGDFETIEILMRGINKFDLSTVAGCCEFYALNCPASQQHRNKIQIQIQSELICSHIENDDTFSIACGGCIDIKNVLKGRKESVYINDLDRDALEFATTVLPLQKSPTRS